MAIQENSKDLSGPLANAVEGRVSSLVAIMSLDEKIDLVTGDLNYTYGFYNAAITRLGIPETTMADGPPGVRINNGAVHEGKATALPAPISLAASWNLDLARAYGDVLGHETRASHHNVFLGPAVDIARLPNGGRNFESGGEDPLLSARIAAAEVDAIQAHAVQACLKHYCVNNQEHERSSVNVQIDEQALREIYLKPFETVISTTQIASLMGAFNKINGVFACENELLLRQILREEWGFKGWVMSDYGATQSTVPSALAGLDQEQPSGVYYGVLLKRAVEQQDVPMEVLDEMCRRILRPMAGLGILDRPLEISDPEYEKHREVARIVAEEGSVLLKNDAQLLPVDASGLRTVLVVGVDADSVNAAGGGSGKVKPAHGVSILDAVRERLGERVTVEFAQGADPISAADLLPGGASIPSSFFRTPDGTRHGLEATVWPNMDFWGSPIATLHIPQVAANLGFFNYPGFGAASERYPVFPTEASGRSSIRFSGKFLPPVSGPYRIGVTILGSVKVWLDDQLIVDFRYHGPDETGGGGGSGFRRDTLDDVFAPAMRRNAFGEAAGAIDAIVAQPFSPDPTTGPVSGDGAEVQHATAETEVELSLDARNQGYDLRVEYAADAPGQGDLSGAQIRLWWVPPQTILSTLAQEAQDKARHADLVIAAVRAYESEHMDRPSIELPNGQADLLRALAEVNPNVVAITMAGGAIGLASWEDQVPAILHTWYAGQEQGTALARLIFGDVSPSGKLPLTFPVNDARSVIRSRSQYPGVDGVVHYAEGLNVGYPGYEALGIAPRFPFGFGLTYADFFYSDLSVDAGAEGIEVRFKLTNRGERAGAEIAQCYMVLPYPEGGRKRLVDFAKVSLAPGEACEVLFLVRYDSAERLLQNWCETFGWKMLEGNAELLVCASSLDVRLSSPVLIREGQTA